MKLYFILAFWRSKLKLVVRADIGSGSWTDATSDGNRNACKIVGKGRGTEENEHVSEKNDHCERNCLKDEVIKVNTLDSVRAGIQHGSIRLLFHESVYRTLYRFCCTIAGCI